MGVAMRDTEAEDQCAASSTEGHVIGRSSCWHRLDGKCLLAFSEVVWEAVILYCSAAGVGSQASPRCLYTEGLAPNSVLRAGGRSSKSLGLVTAL